MNARNQLLVMVDLSPPLTDQQPFGPSRSPAQSLVVSTGSSLAVRNSCFLKVRSVSELDHHDPLILAQSNYCMLAYHDLCTINICSPPPSNFRLEWRFKTSDSHLFVHIASRDACKEKSRRRGCIKIRLHSLRVHPFRE